MIENIENETPEKKQEEAKESYVPKMKPGDVEIPNRVFVKGFPREATADDLFMFFEDYGKVLECRIVADRYGYSKGYGFITFDSQMIAEKVKEMEHIKYNDDIELAIGPARIRKKRFYLLPTPQYQQPQAYYTQDGNVFWATCLPQQQVMQPTQIVSPVQVVHQSSNPPPSVSQQYASPTVSQAYTSPMQPQYSGPPPVQPTYCGPATPQPNYAPQMAQNYGTPVMFSVVTSENTGSQSSPCMYQSTPGQGMNTLVEKMANVTISPSPSDDAVVPNMSQATYVDIQQSMSGQETIVYNPVVSFVPQPRHIQ